MASQDLPKPVYARNMTLIGQRNLRQDSLDLTVGVKPLQTVDKIITAIPVECVVTRIAK